MNGLNGNQRVFLLTMIILALLIGVVVMVAGVDANAARNARLQQSCQDDGGVWTQNICSWSAP